MNLRINKESLQALLNERRAPPEETVMIKTINVISSENIKLQMQLERVRKENEALKQTIVMTGRGGGGAPFESGSR